MKTAFGFLSYLVVMAWPSRRMHGPVFLFFLRWGGWWANARDESC